MRSPSKREFAHRLNSASILRETDSPCRIGRVFIGTLRCQDYRTGPPNRFVDEMVDGAFRWLRHVHEFESKDGLTIMRDRLGWQAPLGLIGNLADLLFLSRHMRWFVATKQSALKQIAERRASIPPA